jgi:SAM-dependent MidA family methyltransferase
MSKDLTFRVELSFSSKITDDDAIMEIAQKIADAIKHECNHGMGIAPDYGDAYTEIVRVTPNYLNKTVIEHVY